MRLAYLEAIRDGWIMTVAFCGLAFVVAFFAPAVCIAGKIGAGKREHSTSSHAQDEKLDLEECPK